MEKWLRFDPEMPYLPSESLSTIAIVASELLGKGFGEELRVERFADSLGLDRNALHRALVDFGSRAGIDLPWLIGEEARVAMAEVICEKPDLSPAF